MAFANTSMRTVHKALGRIPCASILLTSLAVVIHFFNGLRVELLYDRVSLGNVELWRMVTCHWVHLSRDHLFWSAMTFCVLGTVCEVLDKKKYYMALVISVILIPTAIWWKLPGLRIYGGLSGLDCALYALMFTLLINREVNYRNWIWVSFYSMGLVGLLAKVIFETVTGQTVFVSNANTNMIPVPLSHLAGGFVGIMVGTLKSIGISPVQAKLLRIRKYRFQKKAVL